MKKLLLTLLFTISSYPALANHQVVTTVNGLVCDFCAQSIEKVFIKQDAVKSVNVDLDTKLITIDLKDGKSISDETITKLVTDSGYNVEKISRPTHE